LTGGEVFVSLHRSHNTHTQHYWTQSQFGFNVPQLKVWHNTNHSHVSFNNALFSLASSFGTHDNDALFLYTAHVSNVLLEVSSFQSLTYTVDPLAHHALQQSLHGLKQQDS
jgi:hypothetical protein